MREVVSKYIYRTSTGCKVDLRKSGHRATKDFSVRDHGSLKAAESAAKLWLSKKHLDLFGIELCEKQAYGLPRNNKTHIEISGRQYKLYSGMYCERVKGAPAYFTVSKNGGKKRFSISKLGPQKSYEEALKELRSK